MVHITIPNFMKVVVLSLSSAETMGPCNLFLFLLVGAVPLTWLYRSMNYVPSDQHLRDSIQTPFYVLELFLLVGDFQEIAKVGD